MSRTTGILLDSIRFTFAVVFSCALLTQAQAAPEVEAYVGQPLGVARVTVDVFRGEPSLPLNDERFTVVEKDGRAIYPIVKVEPARQFLRGLLGIETPRTVTLYFLFRGEAPFDVSVYSPVEQGVRIKPQRNPQGHLRLLSEWWKQLTERWSRLQKDPEFPPIAENFLVGTFSRRLNRPVPEIGGGLFGLQEKDSALQELFGGEAALLSVDRDMVIGTDDESQRLQDLPPAPNWPSPRIDETQFDEVEIEGLASHVPEECFYLRFGNFTNYFWFRDLNEKWDGDLKNMLLRRGISRLQSSRIEQQLSLKENVLSRILAPQFISDAALIGLDPYMRQGAAIGILVQARNNQLLSQDYMRQRRESLQKFSDATESTVTIAGQDVSLIATPDGRVRSYYAQSGDFHLVATSRKIAERFLEAGQGAGALASLPSFRKARQELDLKREDTIFAFFSEKFFQNLCTPEYWIEVRRRQQAAQQPLLVEMARYAAECEGLPAMTTDELIATGILPKDFGIRADGSHLEETKSGPVDSLRGAPGYFTPVGDMELKQASGAELAAYRKFLANFAEEVGEMPPIAAGVQRLPRTPEEDHTLMIDVLAAPLGTVKLGKLLDSLGDPIEERMKPIAGDVVSFEAVLDVPVPLIGGENQPHILFAGLRDFRSPLVVRRGAVAPNAARSELVRAYVGAWPRPGLLGILQGPDTAKGPEPQALGDQMWQAQAENFLLISFKPDVIQEVEPQLGFEPAERPAQVRFRVDDLTGKQVSEAVNALAYARARETSVAPSRLMNSLANSLHLPRDQSQEFAERLVDGRFVCPLDGEYELNESEGSLPVWSSSALPVANRFMLTEVPEGFKFSFLEWFRGMQGDLRVSDGELAAHVELKMTPAALP
ncbi:hypothetical protein [Bythopirellula polymerisocia]|uniref:Uncharacterized protein n=1 Tax=Bythopirellula polymerisocia TaxID=2528003 RepID=A0A5C6CFL3_9BACT|nr:hypothetical protein [Bythopirellula polymerisocia]TWU22825.1 hypothetical protein Pla144_42860 [Bythopirellula polymerisocia]